MATAKELALMAYREGYQTSRNADRLNTTQERTARSRFERWWSLNVE